MSRGLLFIIGLSASLTGWSQQDPQFTHYMFNNFYFNPAFAGTEGMMKMNFVHRSQWVGYSPSYGDGGAPTTQLISMNTPFGVRSGLGAYLVHDNLGAVTNYEIQTSGAYYFPVRNGRLSVGVRAGSVIQTVDFSKFRAIDPNDTPQHRAHASLPMVTWVDPKPRNICRQLSQHWTATTCWLPSRPAYRSRPRFMPTRPRSTVLLPSRSICNRNNA